MAGSAVSLETGVFHNNTNPVILDGACTHIMFNHPGHSVNLSFQINGYVQLGNDSRTPVRGFGTVYMWRQDGTAHPYQLKYCLYESDLKYCLIGEDELYEMVFGGNVSTKMSKYPALSALTLNFLTKQ